jgi:hypothetical protein
MKNTSYRLKDTLNYHHKLSKVAPILIYSMILISSISLLFETHERSWIGIYIQLFNQIPTTYHQYYVVNLIDEFL